MPGSVICYTIVSQIRKVSRISLDFILLIFAGFQLRAGTGDRKQDSAGFCKNHDRLIDPAVRLGIDLFYQFSDLFKLFI